MKVNKCIEPCLGFDYGSCGATHGRYAAVIAVGQFLQCSALRAASGGLFLLCRLARSTFDLFGIVKRIVAAKAQFRSLAEPWADTGASTGRLMLAVLGRLADVEGDLMKSRGGPMSAKSHLLENQRRTSMLRL